MRTEDRQSCCGRDVSWQTIPLSATGKARSPTVTSLVAVTTWTLKNAVGADSVL